MTFVLLALLVPIFIVNVKFEFKDSLSIVFAFLLFGWCCSTPDWGVYQTRYYNWDGYMIDLTEPLYTKTMQLLNYWNFEFQSVYITIAFAFIIGFTFLVRKLTFNISYVVGLMLISIFPMIISMQRSAYAFCFVFFAFYALFFADSLWIKVTLFSACIVTATLIHSMCIMYFVFLGAYFIKDKTIYKYIKIAIPITIFFLGVIQYFMSDFFVFLDMSKKMDMLNNALDQTSSITKRTFLANLKVLSVIALPIGLNYLLKIKYNQRFTAFDNMVLKLNIAGLIFCPLLYLAHDICRLFYVIAIIDFCVASHYLKYKYCKWYSIFCCFNIGYWFIYRPYFEDVFVQIYSNNLLFDFLL